MHRRADRLLSPVLGLSAVVSGGIVLGVFWFLVQGAFPALREIGLVAPLTQTEWHPIPPADGGAEFGLLAMVAASAAIALGALALAGPIGLLSACFCHLVAPPRVVHGYRRLVELLAGIPSVVYGLWGLVEIVPVLRRVQAPGTSLLAGVLVLSLMIVPTVAMLVDAAFRSVPERELRAAEALALTRVGVVRAVFLPRARAGIRLALLLGLLRAVGETMVVLMVTGNVVRLPGSPFAPVRTLTANIGLELGFASGAHRSMLFVSGLLLLVVVAALIALGQGSFGGGRHGRS